jgi:hypothetical protein
MSNAVYGNATRIKGHQNDTEQEQKGLAQVLKEPSITRLVNHFMSE